MATDQGRIRSPCRNSHSAISATVEDFVEVPQVTSKRQRARAARHDEALRIKLANARTPADRSAVEYDQVRAAIYRLPVEQQPAAWAELTRLHSDFRVKLADHAPAQVAADVHNFTSQRGRGVPGVPRPAARLRARPQSNQPM